MLRRLQGAWRELDGDQRLAGLAALALLVTLFLPWYQATVVEAGPRTTTPSFSAFEVFSFVEAAILLVALGVFVLLFARGERRGFHLPGGDGTVIFGAGVWAALLLLWRVFDRPDINLAASQGITWGFFFAFLAAAALAAAGWKIRTAHRPEPPLRRESGAGAGAGHGPPTAATAVAPRRRRPAEPRVEQLTLDDAAEEETRVVPAERPRRADPSGDEEPPTRRMPFEPEDPHEPPRRRLFDDPPDDHEPLRPGEIPPLREDAPPRRGSTD